MGAAPGPGPGSRAAGVTVRRYAYAVAVGVLLVTFLVLLGVTEALRVPLLTDPAPWLSGGGAVAAGVGVGLLVVDVLLPVPSSLVMLAHGARFGVAAGTLLSLAGSTGAALLGFAVGRRGTGILERVTTTEERERADRLLQRWGTLAVIVSRPVPMLAETIVIVAGTSSLGWRRVAAAAVAGSLPPALLYAVTGAAVADLRSRVLVFAGVSAVAAAAWAIGRRTAPVPTGA